MAGQFPPGCDVASKIFVALFRQHAPLAAPVAATSAVGLAQHLPTKSTAFAEVTPQKAPSVSKSVRPLEGEQFGESGVDCAPADGRVAANLAHPSLLSSPS